MRRVYEARYEAGYERPYSSIIKTSVLGKPKYT
jgi:hypothetical protein